MATLGEVLGKELDVDLAWREAELASLRKLLFGSTKGSTQEAVLLRASVAMVYAHYEGFCKFGLELYLGALRKLKVKRKDLNWTLATYSMAKFHNQLLQEKDHCSFFSLLATEFDKRLEQEAEYESPPQIANLWPDLLSVWLGRLGLDATTVTSEHARLESLVNNRNQIAHGKKITIASHADLDKYARAALLAMHEVAVGVVSALDAKAYSRVGSATTVLNHAI